WFDPRYFMYFEDVDLGDRINRAGWCNVYASSAVVTHLGGHATAREPRRMLLAHHESAYRYVADRHRGLLWVPLLLVIRIGLALRGRYLARHLRHHWTSPTRDIRMTWEYPGSQPLEAALHCGTARVVRPCRDDPFQLLGAGMRLRWGLLLPQRLGGVGVVQRVCVVRGHRRGQHGGGVRIVLVGRGGDGRTGNLLCVRGVHG